MKMDLLHYFFFITMMMYLLHYFFHNDDDGPFTLFFFITMMDLLHLIFFHNDDDGPLTPLAIFVNSGPYNFFYVENFGPFSQIEILGGAQAPFAPPLVTGLLVKNISTHVNHENLSEKWNFGAYPFKADFEDF